MGLCSSSTTTEDHFSEKDQTRFLFSKEINPSLSFAEQLSEAIAARTDNIQQIKRRVLSQLQTRGSMKNRWLKICDESINSGVTLAMVGRVNVGKSTLASALLGCNFTRPSSANEVTTTPRSGRPVRFVYSDKPVLRRIQLLERRSCVWEESILSEKSISVDDWELFVAEDEFVDSSTVITEIGSPSPILRCGLTIVDCPAACLESSSISMLQQMNVTVLCFVYDHRQGFCLNDGQLLKDFLKGFLNTAASTMPEVILIGNKYDVTLQERLSADNDDTNSTVRRNCPWKHAMSSPFIDKDRILPVQLFPTVSAADLQSQFNAEQSVSSVMKSLQCSIVRKIIDSSRAILYKLETIFIFNKFNTDLYFFIKSLLIEKDLIELIHHECCFNDANLLLDFTRGYKVFGLKYRGDDIHITSITNISSGGNDTTTDKQYRQERRDLAARNQPHSIIYESTDGEQFHIYLIEKERSQKRLLDHLQDYSQKQLVEFLQLIDGERIYMNPNFRPDNIFVDRSDFICVNLSIPNHPHLPFLHKNKLLTEPFHLHPRHKHLSKLGRNCCRSYSGQREYCLARTIWILLDGRGMNGMNDANSEDVHPGQMTQDGMRWSYLSEELREGMNSELTDRTK